MSLDGEDVSGSLVRNYLFIKEKVEVLSKKYQGDKRQVSLLVASKRQKASLIQELYKHGARLFGENYVQDASFKKEELKGLGIEWHLLGALQTNKVRKALNLFSTIETLDSVKLAEKLDRTSKELGVSTKCLIEVNVAKERTKSGIFEEDLWGFLEDMERFEALSLEGLMNMPPLGNNPEESRVYFEEVYRLYEEGRRRGYPFKILSMGTSFDYEVAIECGASLVRLGTAIFGERC